MLLAMFFMVLLTFFVGIIMLISRVNSVLNKSISIKYYRLMQGQNTPEHITKSSRCFSNMFEVPMLFYVAITLYLSLNINSDFALIFAWLFLFFRLIQACIHLTYNNVIHRMFAFLGGVLSVLALWINLILQIN